MSKSATWFEILEILRVLSENGKRQFTSSSLVEAAGLKDTPKRVFSSGPRKGETSLGSTAVQIASGWLSKFRRWGYVEIVDTKPSSGPKPSNIYALTQKGLSCELRSSRQEQLSTLKTQLETLLESTVAYRDLRGKPAEGQAWKDLLKVIRETEEMVKNQNEPNK